MPARPISRARSPRNGIGSGIVISRPRMASPSKDAPQPDPRPDRDGPSLDDLVGEVEADSSGTRNPWL